MAPLTMRSSIGVKDVVRREQEEEDNTEIEGMIPAPLITSGREGLQDDSKDWVESSPSNVQIMSSRNENG